MNFIPIHLAYSSLQRQKRRTLLTMLAIAIGIGAVITIMAAGRGVERLVLGQLEVFGADTIEIETKIPNVTKTSNENAMGQATGITITTLKERDVETIRQHSNIITAYGMVHGQETVSYNGELRKVFLLGNGYNMLEIERATVAAGRFYTREEEDALASVVVLGSKTKEKLFGEEDAIDKTIHIRGKPFRVIGVMAPRGSAFFFDMDTVIVIPVKTLTKKILGINYLQFIMAKLRDPERSTETAAELTELIRLNHNIDDAAKDDFAVNTTAEAEVMLKTVTSGVTLLLSAIIGLSLVVGGIGIMNIMYVSVAERTFEIGLRKSIGATAGDIRRQFLSEAVMTTLGGGVAGIALGVVVALIVYLAATSYGFKWVYSISPWSIILAVGFSAGIGVLFGWYPAKKAAALNPIDALRRE